MSITFWNALKVTSALFGVSLLIASSAYARENTTEQTAVPTVETAVQVDTQLAENTAVSQLTPLETRSTANLPDNTPVSEVAQAEAAPEAQYRFPITENILITPGVIMILNPNHNADNDTIYLGVIRTTFTF